jgi:TolB-like protein/Flp pilus assembly protein TadD
MERRLAAILAADVAGYSRLMGIDEEGTHKDLKAHCHDLVEPKIQQHRGRIIKNTGDGFLAEFTSVLDAVRCATEIQQGMALRNTNTPDERRIEFRIGVHQGDIITDSGDIFGDGVNVAARLEGIADPGGICVSARVQEDVRGKLDLALDDIGEQRLKNIERPVRVYSILLENKATRSRPALAMPDRPSIAVLPFQNMSGDPEQDYFADGITEDLITGLSQIRWLFVIARNSTFVYKGRAVDVKQVSRELGVRYVLEGSVRRVGNRIRTSAQLIDGTTGTHHWAERYDREFTDIFMLQDEITRSVAAAIEPRMLAAEGIRSLARSADDLDAWALVARALTYFGRISRDDTHTAIEILEKATARYPDYALAHSLLSYSLIFAGHMGWIDQVEALKKSRRHINVAAKLDDNDPWVHIAFGYLAMLERRGEASIAAFHRALELNPNSAVAHGQLGRGLTWAGRSDEGISELELAIRLSPNDPQKPIFMGTIALAHYFAGRFTQAVDFATQSCKLRPDYWSGRRVLCAGLAKSGRIDEARQQLATLQKEHHELSVVWMRKNFPLGTAELLERYLDGLRAAGLT